MRKGIILILVCAALSISACSGQTASTTAKNTETVAGQEESADSVISQIADTLMSEVGVPEKGAEGTAELLVSVGCTKIKNVHHIEDNGSSYVVTIKDNNNNEYTFSMGYDGYPGYIKDGSGNYLYAPVD